MKEKRNNPIRLSSLLVHVCVKLETKYIYTKELVAGVTGHVFTTLKVLLSIYSSRYKGGVVSTAAFLYPTPGSVIPSMQADGNYCCPYQHLIPCSTPATTKI